MTYQEQVSQALQYLKGQVSEVPRIVMILGSGLGKLADFIEKCKVIPYGEIPHWPLSTAPGHAGQLVCGALHGVPVAAMQGRIHFYEGYSMEQVTFPVRVFGSWGIKTLIVTNASGGINYDLKPGNLVLISDHINFMGTNPLIGANCQDWGPRFPDMTYGYSPKLIALAEKAAQERKILTRRGVYIAFTGPSYETPAEIRMARTMGADLVGMSTVPEVIVANHMGIEVCALSCVANRAAGMSGNRLSGEEVLQEMAKASDQMTSLISGLVELIAQE